MLRVGDKPLRLLRAGRGHRPGRAARRRGVLRLRRHVLHQERRHLVGDAGRQGPQRGGHRRRPVHRRRRVLPDEHRRWPVPAATPGSARSTWPRSWPPPERVWPHEHLPGHSPACVPRGRGVAAAGHPAVPQGGPQGPGQRSAAPQPGPRHLGHPGQAGAGGRRDARLGGAAGHRLRGQDAGDGPAAGAAGTVRGERDRPRRCRALGDRRRGGQPDRHRPGPRAGRGRGDQGQVDGHPGDRAQRVPGRRRHRRGGDRSRRADRAAGPRQALAHPGAGHPPQPHRGPGHLPGRDGRRPGRSHRRAAPAGDGRPGAPAAQVPAHQGRHLRHQLRHRRDRHHRRGRVRGQRPDVRDPAARR